MKGPTDIQFNEPMNGRRQTRMALLLLLVGVLILLVTLGLAVLRTEAPAVMLSDDSPRSAGSVDETVSAQAATVMLVYGSILLLVFVVAAIALVTASRGFRRQITRGRFANGRPTPVDDVWSQHRLADDTMTPKEPPEQDGQ